MAITPFTSISPRSHIQLSHLFSTDVSIYLSIHVDLQIPILFHGYNPLPSSIILILSLFLIKFFFVALEGRTSTYREKLPRGADLDLRKEELLKDSNCPSLDLGA